MTEDKEIGLPAEVLAALESGEQDMRHNWMYSFMPLGNDWIFLVGYCKTCDTGVSSRMNIDSAVGYSAETKMNIPKWGCKPVEGL